MVHAISGLPQKSMMFFLGMPLLPPLAKTIAATFMRIDFPDY
jgi:hypothetical protein